MARKLVNRSRFSGYKGMARIGRGSGKTKETKVEKDPDPVFEVGDICQDLVKDREVEIIKLGNALSGGDQVRVKPTFITPSDTYPEYWQDKENLKLIHKGKDLEFARIMNSIQEKIGKTDSVSVWQMEEHVKKLKAFIADNPKYKYVAHEVLKILEIPTEMETEKIPGGLAKGKSIEEIADMHGSDLGYAMEQLEAGIKVEIEHTSDPNIAREIAMDHLFEDIKYYIKLTEMETGKTEGNAEENLVKEVNAQDVIELHIEDEKPFLIGDCRFPKMNKNDSLAEYEEQLGDPEHYNVETVGIRKIVVVNTEKWDEITNSLLDDRAELWEKIGGSEMYDEVAKEHNVPEDEKEFSEWIDNPDNLKLFRENNYIPAVALFNRDTQEAIIINTEGGGYARYVGFFDEFSGKIVISNYINAKVYGKFEAMDKIQEGVKLEFDSELEKINHIRHLIDEKWDDILKYSAKELMLLDSYMGMGGQAKKVEKGTHDVGILDQYYTPYQAIEKMWGLAVKHGFKFSAGKKILEPSCGIGRFFEFVPTFCKAVGYEIDKYAAVIAKLKFPEFTIINDLFETMFFDKIKRYVPPVADFDLVIGNPPYREFVSKWAVIEDAMKENEKTRTSAVTYDQYFMMRGVDLLKPGGLLIFIIPNTFLSNDNKYNEFKERLNKKAELIDAYRLPNKLFSNTDISTDIIVLKKR